MQSTKRKLLWTQKAIAKRLEEKYGIKPAPPDDPVYSGSSTVRFVNFSKAAVQQRPKDSSSKDSDGGKIEMAKGTWKMASKDSPIFSGRFVISSHSSIPESKQLKKSLPTNTDGLVTKRSIIPIEKILPEKE